MANQTRPLGVVVPVQSVDLWCKYAEWLSKPQAEPFTIYSRPATWRNTEEFTPDPTVLKPGMWLYLAHCLGNRKAPLAQAVRCKMLLTDWWITGDSGVRFQGDPFTLTPVREWDYLPHFKSAWRYARWTPPCEGPFPLWYAHAKHRYAKTGSWCRRGDSNLLVPLRLSQGEPPYDEP